jgi:uncharacterized repeat protein (TIGR03803 family)
MRGAAVVVATALLLPAGAARAQQQYLSVLYTFPDGDDRTAPAAGLLQATDGNFYGTAASVGAGRGLVFKMTPGGSVTVLHAFTGHDGSDPVVPLIQAADGNLYGTTSTGGTVGSITGNCERPFFDHICGTVFRMTTSGTHTLLHTFMWTDGAYPGALLEAADGNFYATTRSGGAFGKGALVQVTPSGSVTVLHSFTGGADGASPLGSLIQATNGHFYGTTTSGGVSDFGTVFEMTPGGALNVLHTFTGGTDGAAPSAGLIHGSDGNFYGTTTAGGPADAGTVFQMTPSGTVTILHAFTGGTGGSGPGASLIQATDGNFYGTTLEGGWMTGCPPLGCGTVFRMTVTGTVAVLHAFTGGTDGFRPAGSLIQAFDGKLYGTTWGAGVPNAGIVFRLRSPECDGDIDGDGKAEITVYRPGTSGVWYVRWSRTNYSADTGFQWGTSSDLPVPADYDGDGKTDIAVYRPARGEWYILLSGTSFTGYITYQWGTNTDIPVVGDYDGDGRADVAVYRPVTGVWYVVRFSLHSMTYVTYQWGVATDLPVPADYDGDGKTDIAIYRPAPGEWHVLRSAANFATYVSYQWGVSTDSPVPADYDGDGRVDLAVYRPATGSWYVLLSRTGFTTYVSYQWGISSDVPVPSDYDGDGKTDIAVFRPATGFWYILLSSTNSTSAIGYQWGAATDSPVLKRS